MACACECTRRSDPFDKWPVYSAGNESNSKDGIDIW
jgi:hypothetical protein